MGEKNIIGIDMGGTNVRAGLVNGSNISEIISRRVNSAGSVEEVMQDVFNLTDKLMNSAVNAIGIGVPSVVDVEQGYCI